MNKLIESAISEVLKEEGIKIKETPLESPPNQDMGDFAFPCFMLAKEMKKSPKEIASYLKEKIKLPKGVKEVKALGPYLNFFVDRISLAKGLVKEILSKKEKFGKNNSGNGRVLAIDLSAPNIAKPFGIGHLRSTIIGDSIAKIAEFNSYKPIKINYLGDWGTQFGKLIYAYKSWGDKEKLEKDPISHLQELYVKVNSDKEYEELSRAEFKKLEEGDKENLKLWEEFRELSLKEFDKIYELLGIKFDDISGESLYNDKMGEVVDELDKKGLLTESEGAKVVDLNNEGLGVALIQKSDGTSLYATRDIAAAIDRYEKYGFDTMIYEVGSEQKLHFKQLFKILELLQKPFAKNCFHVSHGLYLGKDGKKFSTRKGKTVYLKDVLEETIKKAKNNLKERDEKLNPAELEEKGKKISLAAIKYGDLKNYRENDMIFDIDNFLSFEGNTGPYLLYSFARANSILNKAEEKEMGKLEKLDEGELKLVKKLEDFKKVIENAYRNFNPALVANYAFELSQNFNEFYHSCPVIGGDKEGFRLGLVKSFKIVLGNSLNLLGITPLEKM
jgi:arginyl-tRNA synthetase